MEEEELVEIYELMSSDESRAATPIDEVAKKSPSEQPPGTPDDGDPAVKYVIGEGPIAPSIVKLEDSECAKNASEFRASTAPARSQSKAAEGSHADNEQSGASQSAATEMHAVTKRGQPTEIGSNRDAVLVRMVKNSLLRKRWGCSESEISAFLERRNPTSSDELSQCLTNLLEAGEIRKEVSSAGQSRYFLTQPPEASSSSVEGPSPAKRTKPTRVWREPSDPSVLFAPRSSRQSYHASHPATSTVVRGIGGRHGLLVTPMQPSYPSTYDEYSRDRPWTERNGAAGRPYPPVADRNRMSEHTPDLLDVPSHPGGYGRDYIHAFTSHSYADDPASESWKTPARRYDVCSPAEMSSSSTVRDILIINDGTLFGLEPLTRCTVDINHMQCRPSTVEEALGHSEFIERYHPDFFLDPRNRIIGELRIHSLLQHTLVMWASRFDLTHPSTKEFLLDVLDPRQATASNSLFHWINFRDKLPDQPGRRTERDVLSEDFNLAIRQRLYTCDVTKETLLGNADAEIRFTSNVGQELGERDAVQWLALWQYAGRVIDTVRRIQLRRMPSADSWRPSEPVAVQKPLDTRQAVTSDGLRAAHDAYHSGTVDYQYRYQPAASDERYGGDHQHGSYGNNPGRERYSPREYYRVPPVSRDPSFRTTAYGATSSSVPRYRRPSREYPTSASGSRQSSGLLVDDSTAYGLEPWTECGVHESHTHCELETVETAMKFSAFSSRHHRDFFRRRENRRLASMGIRTLLQHILVVWASRFDVSHPITQDFIIHLLDPVPAERSKSERAIQLWLNYRNRMPVHPNEPDTIRDVLPKDLRIALKQHWYRCQVLRETLEQNRFLDFTTSVGCELPVTSAEGANWRMLWSKVPGAIGFLRKRSTPKPGGHEAVDDVGNEDEDLEDLILQDSVEDDRQSPPSDIDEPTSSDPADVAQGEEQRKRRPSSSNGSRWIPSPRPNSGEVRLEDEILGAIRRWYKFNRNSAAFEFGCPRKEIMQTMWKWHQKRFSHVDTWSCLVRMASAGEIEATTTPNETYYRLVDRRARY